MNQSIGKKSSLDAPKRAGRGRNIRREVQPHPRSTAIISSGKEAEGDLDQPFVEGAQDMLGPNVRHRMISEAAYRHYVDRGYADGYDVDDWLQAEAEIDHLLLNPRLPSGPQSAA